MERRVRRSWIWLVPGSMAVLLLALAVAPVADRVHAADKPTLDVVSPTAGAKVTSDDIAVQLKVSNYKIDCQQAGRPDQQGVGHIHLMIDGMSMASLANFYCAEGFTVPGDGLKPGKHKLIIALATNSHVDLMDTAKEVEIDYEPATPKPLPAANDQGEPGVQLVSPSDGATVPAKFAVTVKPVNFTPAANLEGKGNVPGYGHWHVFVDTPMGNMGNMGSTHMGTPEGGKMGSPEAGMKGTPEEGGMAGGQMAMGGMVLMPGTDTFELDLTAWGPGQHTVWIEPVQNDHTQFEQFGHVEFKVNVT